MIKKNILLFCLMSFILSCSKNSAYQPDLFHTANQQPESITINPQVIYGTDNRMDWFEVSDPRVLKLADSTLGILDKTEVRNFGDKFILDTYPSRLCPTENFYQQKRAPWCSGFLVSSDTIVTAGHCVESQSHCNMLSFVFGFAKKGPDSNPAILKATDVYSCKTLINRRFSEEGSDWAIVKLDRPVYGRTPLKMRKLGSTQLATPLTIIGHSYGLPSKISQGGHVHDLKDSYFRANIDSFSGNSGAPVFNSITHEVEGILVRGRTDYKFSNGCVTANVCEDKVDGSCSFRGNKLKGEHVNYITEVSHLISDDRQDDDAAPEPTPPETSFPPSSYLNEDIQHIPDNHFKEIESYIYNVPALTKPQSLKVIIKIKHSSIGDLSIKLKSPNGVTISLRVKNNDRTADLEGVYGLNLESVDSFAELGQQPSGTWGLEVKDNSPFDSGSLLRWGLIL